MMKVPFSHFQRLLLLLCSIALKSQSLIHHLRIHRDDRKVFKIETFGFTRGGRMELTVRDFKIHLTAAEKIKYSPEHEQEKLIASGSANSPNTANAPAAVPVSNTQSTASAAPTAPAVPTAAQPVATAAAPAAAAAQIQPVPPKPAQPIPAAANPVVPVAANPQPAPAPIKPAPAANPGPMVPSAAANMNSNLAQKAPIPPVGVVAKPKPAPYAASASAVARRSLLGAAAPAGAAATAVAAVQHEKGFGSEVKEVMHEKNKYLVGFVMRKASSESDAQADLENLVEKDQCIIEHMNEDDIFIDLSDPSVWKSYSATQEVGLEGVGLYSLIFARCAPHGQHFVEFELDAVFYNPGWGTGTVNYLSAGDTPLPKLYLIFFLLFSAALVAWVMLLRRESRGSVHRIHYMMLALLVIKCCSLLFESIRFHYIALLGASELWSIVYYIFAFVKGVMLFTVILLIGSGWSLMKSYLNEKEKRIVYSVLVLQVLDNIAMIVLEETAPGSQGWLTWRDILHLVDIICCCAILLPIVWSIRHLRMAAETDGKAYNAVVKLQLFRQFYVMVVAYIYFTRIVVFLLSATIPYYLLWLGPLSTELATLIFYVFTGYKFRPAPDNAYLPVRSENLEGEEYGLEEGGDDGFELMGNVSSRGSSAAAHTVGRVGSLK